MSKYRFEVRGNYRPMAMITKCDELRAIRNVLEEDKTDYLFRACYNGAVNEYRGVITIQKDMTEEEAYELVERVYAELEELIELRKAEEDMEDSSENEEKTI